MEIESRQRVLKRFIFLAIVFKNFLETLSAVIHVF